MTHDPGNNFAIGDTSVTYTAVDDAGNTALCTFIVSIVGKECYMLQLEIS